MFIPKIALFLICANVSYGQICETKQNCQDCIQEIDCEWCTEPLDTIGKHCRSKNSSSKWCDRSKLFPKNLTYEKIQDHEFSYEESRMIQMKPQRVKLSLRKGQKFNLNFQFQTIVNYPVDLYYLMDLSSTMEQYKTDLANLGILLTDSMKNLTKNFMIGFGSFIDKVDLPFTSTVPSKLFPRKGDRPYSFKNILPLSNDYDSFVTNVNSTKTAQNIDFPEGGFDAIMQAIVCKGKINWRDQARHLLVFVTDGPFHIAGDGKLGGVVEPNPGRCYKDEKEYLIYDYPSVSHINYVAKENNINILFALVESKYKKSYEDLSNNIENSKFGEFTGGDDSIIKLIVDNYNKIVQSVKFTSNATKEIDIQFSSYCNGSVKSERCTDVTKGKIIKFNATIQQIQCPKDGERTKIISIKPEAINESLIIELELECDCPCSNKDDITFKPNSVKCNGIGNFTCGICSCPAGRFGVNCECDTAQSKSQNVTNCFKEGITTEVCSGTGACNTCGKCECNVIPNTQGQKYSGEFCECNNFSCRRKGGLLCSGKGKCNCNKCECHKGFSGEACECDLATTNCRAGDSDSICSGHGKCDCNRCQCEMKDNNRYSGKLCEDCTTCPAQRCEELRPCVECQVYKTGIYKDTCDSKCTAFRTEKMHTLDNEENNEYKKCKIPDNETCIINFEYSYGYDDKLIVRALDRKICPEPPNVLAWILGVIATILIAGIIMLIIWKILTTIHDEREYAKFEKDQNKLKWGTQDNPLYNNPMSSYSNPVYHRGSVRYSIRKD